MLVVEKTPASGGAAIAEHLSSLDKPLEMLSALIHHSTQTKLLDKPENANLLRSVHSLLTCLASIIPPNELEKPTATQLHIQNTALGKSCLALTESHKTDTIVQQLNDVIATMTDTLCDRQRQCILDTPLLMFALH